MPSEVQRGDDIILRVGDGGRRWELSWTRRDAAFLRDVIEAVVDGRVTEIFGLARSEVRVTLRDGTVAETAQADVPLGCLPGPWRRRSQVRRVDYVSYRRTKRGERCPRRAARLHDASANIRPHPATKLLPHTDQCPINGTRSRLLPWRQDSR
ncbi:hypothetical protein GCM10009774_23530 [Cellulomonas gelida]|uniref:Uncharacterized protein n=1 Tax=Cellulomonas gelida TaxID=1712 RepID=A0A4Y3KKD2_9CELL|nr:hypothetical protein CGE01nite_10650 [Cellulomonas gelida]GGL32301.1 hypothetical protein GCM10009774_23530 [Cellulomonas gelida]